MIANKKIWILALTLSMWLLFAFSTKKNFEIHKRIYLMGIITYKNDNTPVEGATVGIKGTKIYNEADKLGNYKLDITGIVDTSKTFVVLATYVECRLMEVYFNYKVKKSTTLNMELSRGARGDSEKFVLDKPMNKK